MLQNCIHHTQTVNALVERIDNEIDETTSRTNSKSCIKNHVRTRLEVGRAALAHSRENLSPPIIKHMRLYQVTRLAAHERNELKMASAAEFKIFPGH